MKANKSKVLEYLKMALLLIFPITVGILLYMAKKIKAKVSQLNSAQLTKNFWLYEFDSKDGVKVPKELIPNVKKLATNLQVIRDYLGKPLTINSGYRSPGHNKTIGGQSASYHMKGLAADLDSIELTPTQIYDAIQHLIKEGKISKGGLKKYSGWIHYDVRGTMASW